MEVNRLGERVSLLERRVENIESERASLAAHSKPDIPPATVIVAPKPSRPRRDPETLSRRDIQRALRTAGYYRGSIDGIFGPRTRRAIKLFQRDHNLKVDGIAGRITKQAIVQNIDW